MVDVFCFITFMFVITFSFITFKVAISFDAMNYFWCCNTHWYPCDSTEQGLSTEYLCGRVLDIFQIL